MRYFNAFCIRLNHQHLALGESHLNRIRFRNQIDLVSLKLFCIFIRPLTKDCRPFNAFSEQDLSVHFSRIQWIRLCQNVIIANCQLQSAISTNQIEPRLVLIICQSIHFHLVNKITATSYVRIWDIRAQIYRYFAHASAAYVIHTLRGICPQWQSTTNSYTNT